MMKSNLIRTRKNPINHIGMASILRQVLDCMPLPETIQTSIAEIYTLIIFYFEKDLKMTEVPQFYSAA